MSKFESLRPMTFNELLPMTAVAAATYGFNPISRLNPSGQRMDV